MPVPGSRPPRARPARSGKTTSACAAFSPVVVHSQYLTLWPIRCGKSGAAKLLERRPVATGVGTEGRVQPALAPGRVERARVQRPAEVEIEGRLQHDGH